MRLRTWLPGRSDAGLTLTEMVVVVALLGIVLAIVQQTTIMVWKQVNQSAMRLDETQRGKVAMEAMTKVIRTAVLPTQLYATCTGCDSAAFISGQPRSVQFFANLNNADNLIGPSKVTYNVLADGKLVEKIQAPDAHAAGDYDYRYCTEGSAGCTVRTRILAENVSTTKPLFTYYDGAGAAITTPLSGTRLADVDSMDIVLFVDSSGQTPGTTVTTRVTLPNADAVAQSE